MTRILDKEYYDSLDRAVKIIEDERKGVLNIFVTDMRISRLDGAIAMLVEYRNELKRKDSSCNSRFMSIRQY